ncbi:hypothetical protein ES707_05044 [subsurface metagenome]
MAESDTFQHRPVPVQTPLASGLKIDAEADRIELGEASVRVGGGAAAIQGQGRALLYLQPKLTLMVEAEFSQAVIEAYAALDAGQHAEFTFGDDSRKTVAIATHLRVAGDDNQQGCSPS